MRTSIELPDPLFREVKTLALARNLTFKALVTESLKRTVQEQGLEDPPPGWKRHIGTLDAAAADEVERRLAALDREASHVAEREAQARSRAAG